MENHPTSQLDDQDNDAIDDENQQPGLLKEFRSRTNRIKITIILAMFMNFSTGVLFGIVDPLYPIIAEKKGLPPALITSMIAFFQVALLLSAPVVGHLQNRFRTNIVLGVGGLLMGASDCAFSNVDKLDNYSAFVAISIILRMLEGIGAGTIMICCYSINAHLFPSHIASVYGIMDFLQAVGSLMGTIVGGILFTIGGFQLPLLTNGCVVIASGVFAIVVVQTFNPDVMEATEGWTRLLLHPLFIIDCVAYTFYMIAFGFVVSNLSLHLIDRYNLDKLYLILSFSILPITMLLSPLWGYVTDRNKKRSALIFCFGCLLMCFGLFFLGPPFFSGIEYPLAFTLVSIGFFGTGKASVGSAASCIKQAALQQGFKENFATNGLLMANMRVLYALGIVIGSVCGGTMMQELGFENASMILCLLLFASATPLCIYGLLDGPGYRLTERRYNYGSISN